MLNHKFIIRLIIGLMLSLIVISSSTFAGDTVECYAVTPGPIVDMHERPHTKSIVVNTLESNDTYPVVAIRKTPSELEPEGAYVLWLLLEPQDGTPSGWVMYNDVIVFGSECNKFGI